MLTVHSELELKELADVIEHRPTPQHGSNDGGEPVVHDNWPKKNTTRKKGKTEKTKTKNKIRLSATRQPELKRHLSATILSRVLRGLD